MNCGGVPFGLCIICGVARCWWPSAAVLALMSAFSIGRVTSGGNTGLRSIEFGIGSFQVLSKLSICLRVMLSTKVYASMKVLYKFRPRYTVYGVPTVLTIISRTYSAGSFLFGAVWSGVSLGEDSVNHAT